MSVWAAVVVDKRPASPCRSNIDSPAPDSKRFDWVARLAALVRSWGEVYLLSLLMDFGGPRSCRI